MNTIGMNNEGWR
jgi:hypothetical protein